VAARYRQLLPRVNLFTMISSPRGGRNVPGVLSEGPGGEEEV